MPAFTAEQASINNGSKVVQINSGESVANICSGDFLVLAGFIVEINRAFVGAANEQLIELVQAWSHSTQSNQSCIVIPTTAEFKTVVAALNEANMLVNNNYKAMQDWQTKAGTVTFSNKDGTTTTVKTLKQIETDNAAQLEAYHPYPWAMRKVEFEARRAANRERFAASGWVYNGFGHSSNNVNQGMWVTGNNIFLGKSGVVSGHVDDSKREFPVLLIDGIEFYLENISTPSGKLNMIKRPSPEDGTVTFDSATGAKVKHATPAIAFASETDTNKVLFNPVCVWGFEGFLREVTSEDPFVYRHGCIQSSATGMNGVATEFDNIRPLTYFEQFDGDDSRGRGVNWYTASDSQRNRIASDHKNKIYFDDVSGKWYQACVRVLNIKGVENRSWPNYESSKSFTLSPSPAVKVTPQGVKNQVSRIAALTTIYTSGWFESNALRPYSGIESSKDPALFTASISGSGSVVQIDSSFGVDGQCFWLTCGTINTLNSGLYHPSFNPFGSAKASDDKDWRLTSVEFNSMADCFEPTKLLSGSGFVASAKTGRPDGRYCDLMYTSGFGGVCEDLRLNARGYALKDSYLQKRKMIEGTLRGVQYIVKSKLLEPGNILSFQNATIRVSGSEKNKFAINAIHPSKIIAIATGFEKYSCTHISGFGYANKQINTSKLTYLGTENGWDVYSGLVLCEFETDTLIAGQYLTIDLIGDLPNISETVDLRDGLLGHYIEDIPDGQTPNWKLQKKSLDSLTTQRTYTTDNGNTWLYSSNTPIDVVENSIKNQPYPTGFVQLVPYTASSGYSFQHSDQSIIELSADVFSVEYLGFYLTYFGALLVESLLDKVPTNNSTASSQIQPTVGVSSMNFRPDSSIDFTGGREIRHETASISQSNDSPAVKIHFAITEINQLAYLSMRYVELKHNGTDWGDDGKIHIADNQTTMLDENGNTVLVGTARCVEPLGWIKNDK